MGQPKREMKCESTRRNQEINIHLSKGTRHQSIEKRTTAKQIKRGLCQPASQSKELTTHSRRDVVPLYSAPHLSLTMIVFPVKSDKNGLGLLNYLRAKQQECQSKEGSLLEWTSSLPFLVFGLNSSIIFNKLCGFPTSTLLSFEQLDSYSFKPSTAFSSWFLHHDFLH